MGHSGAAEPIENYITIMKYIATQVKFLIMANLWMAA